MKKFIALSVLSLGIIFLTGCDQQQTSQTQPTTNQPVVTQPSAANDLLQYGEKTEQTNKNMDPIVFNGSEIGSGSLLNDDESKSLDKWYFEKQGIKQTLVIDDKCLIHSVGFRNGSCLKYLAIDKNKNVIYDGVNGHSVAIYGKILADKSIQVSDIMLQQ